MLFRRVWLGACLGWMTLAASVCQAQTTKVSEWDASRAKALASALGSSDDKKRADAAVELRGIGPKALVPVLRQIEGIKEPDVQLIAKLAACRVLAFADLAIPAQLTTNDEKLSIEPGVLKALATAVKDGDEADRKVAHMAVALLCFSTNGSAVPDIRAACKDVKAEQVEKILEAAVAMHATSLNSMVEQLAKPSAKVKMLPMELYDDQVKAICRYGASGLGIVEKMRDAFAGLYRDWEKKKDLVSFNATDEQWMQYVGIGSQYYTLDITYGQMAKVLKQLKP